MKISPLIFSEAEMQESVKLAVSKSEAIADPDDIRVAFSCIDLTTLNSTDTATFVSDFVHKVNRFEAEFPGLPNVAAICVYPNMVPVVKETLGVEQVRIASVAGGFPSSMTYPEIKIEEARQALSRGADEIDIVLPLWAFLDGNQDACFSEIKTLKKVTGDSHLKVIIESGILAEPQKIWEASIISLSAGADFIKTSTGKSVTSATPEAAWVMCRAIKFWHEKTGEKRGFKPAGGIVSTKEALIYIEIVKQILGKEWMNNHLFRIGASRLANNLLSSLFSKEIKHF